MREEDVDNSPSSSGEGLEPVTAAGLFLAFLRLGLTAFGGPAMVAYIRELSTRRHRWLGDAEFKGGVALCQSVPGPIAMHAAAFVGLKSHGLKGALLAYIAFGLPAFLLLLVLSALYASSRELSGVAAIFSGLQVIVVAIVTGACYRFGRDTLKRPFEVLLAAAAAGLLWLGASPFGVIAGAALIGGATFRSATPDAVSLAAEPVSWTRRLLALLLPTSLALLLLYLASPPLFGLAVLMARIDLFAYGGGYGALPLMLHEVVEARGWLDYQTFLDGIALGQVTPGPVIITATFIGYMTQGLPGALVATLAIFAPSFILLVAIAPLFDRLQRSPFFRRAIRGILASFVGLLLFAAIKFGLAVPWDWLRLALGAAALGALLRRVDVLYVVLAGAALSFVFFR